MLSIYFDCFRFFLIFSIFNFYSIQIQAFEKNLDTDILNVLNQQKYDRSLKVNGNTSLKKLKIDSDAEEKENAVTESKHFSSKISNKAGTHLKSTPRVDNTVENVAPIYYISTDEGLLSHFRQLEILWNIANSVGRTLVAIPFHSDAHYSQVDTVSLCDIFDLPRNLTCSTETQEEIFKTHKCIYTGYMHPPEYYGFDHFMEISNDFDYSTVDCVAGGISLSIGKYNQFKREHIATDPFFTDKYLEALPIIRNLLGLESADDEYTVAHWRRGDILESRCHKDFKNSTRLVGDKSLNCAKVADFESGLRDAMKKVVPSDVKVTYISTNDNDISSHIYLQSLDYKLYSDIGVELLRKYPTINAVDMFVFELMLMCDATYLLAWGDSAVHQFVRKCRFHHHGKNKVTVIEGN